MNRIRNGSMGLFVGLILTLALMGQASGQSSGLASGQACARDMSAELDDVVSRTLSAVQSDDAGALLALIGDDGVNFNPEGDQVAHQVLQSQFSEKAGRYCAFFTCNGRRGDLGAKFKRGQIDTQIDSRNGLATVFVNANTNDELQLNYRLRDCRWELTGVAMVE